MANAAKSLPEPPTDITGEARALWDAVVADLVLEAHHLALLREACRALHRACEARVLVDRDGLVTMDRFDQPREHPGVQIELANRRLFRSLIRELGLDADTVEEYARPGHRTPDYKSRAGV